MSIMFKSVVEICYDEIKETEAYKEFETLVQGVFGK